MAARRRRTTKRRRSRKQSISILGLAEAGLMIGALTKGLFNNSIMGFILPGSFGTGVSWSGSEGGEGTAYSTGRTLSLNEFWGVGSGISGYMSPMESLRENLKANGWNMAVQMITIPLVFKVGKQLARPAINQTNRLIANVGLKAVKL